MTRWTTLIKDYAHDESGTTAIEYSMICMLIVIGIIALIDQIGASVMGFFVAVAAGFA